MFFVFVIDCEHEPRGKSNKKLILINNSSLKVIPFLFSVAFSYNPLAIKNY